MFSVNTLAGRIKGPFATKRMAHSFDGTWAFGMAKVVHKHGKLFLHSPLTKNIEEAEWAHRQEIVGVDRGVDFLLSVYDSHGKAWFINGSPVKDRRAHYKQLRRHLQPRQTPSARQRLKLIGQRETRGMTDVNHQIPPVNAVPI